MRWTDIQAHVRARYQVAGEGPLHVELYWQFPDGDERVRQHQMIRSGESGGEPFVIIAAEVIGGEALGAEEALRCNATMSVGAIAVEDDIWMVRHGVRESDLTGDALDRALLLVAHEAARLSQRVRPRPSVAGASGSGLFCGLY